MSNSESKLLYFLYNNIIGRFILKILSTRFISKICAIYLNSWFSKILIKPFIRKNNIDMNEYCNEKYKNFNDFFSRKIKPEMRPIDKKENHLISPSDGLLSTYRIKEGLVIPVKQSEYTIASLLKNDELAKKYENGICLVIRLCVNNYHRYCYIDDGVKSKNIYIAGKLNTVRPIALMKMPVFTQNCREYTIMQTKNFGDVIQMEVGALLIGKIKNYHQESSISRGQEKGTFLFGGSTIILLFEKDKINICKEFFEMTNINEEIPIKMGEKIGLAKKK